VPTLRPQLDFPPEFSADATLGVFETLLVVNGRPVAPERHLARLAASARALYGVGLPRELDAQLAGAAVGHALARLRIELVAHGAVPATVSVGAVAIDPTAVRPTSEAALVSVAVVGGAGPHKLIDRSWLGQIDALAGPEVRPLLVTRGGALLETTRANVLLLRGGELATPPLDGSILAGTVRAALLEHAARLGITASEVPLTLAELEQADIVLLSGSVKLLELARLNGGRRSAEVATRLGEALWEDLVS